MSVTNTLHASSTLAGWTALMTAARAGDLALLRALIDGGSDVHAVNPKGMQALTIACEHGHTEVSRALLKTGAFVDHFTPNDHIPGSVSKRTALMYAALGGHSDIVELLISHGAKLGARDTTGSTALMMACRCKQTDSNNRGKCVHMLIETDVGINRQDKRDRTALMYAALAGDFYAVKCLVDSHGADTTMVDVYLSIKQDGWTAVTLALRNVQSEGALRGILYALDFSYENVNAFDPEGYTPLMRAAGKDWKIIEDWLHDEKADLNMQCKAESNEGWTALMFAVHANQIAIVISLLRYNADVHIQNSVGRTALMLATLVNRVDVMQLLLDAGALVTVTDVNGCDALSYATQLGQRKATALLVGAGAQVKTESGTASVTAAGAETTAGIEVLLLAMGPWGRAKHEEIIARGIDKPYKDGETALMRSVTYSDAKDWRALLIDGANVNLQCKRGWTALMYAADKGRAMAVKALLKAGADSSLRNKDGQVALDLAHAGKHTLTANHLTENVPSTSIRKRKAASAASPVSAKRVAAATTSTPTAVSLAPTHVTVAAAAVIPVHRNITASAGTNSAGGGVLGQVAVPGGRSSAVTAVAAAVEAPVAIATLPQLVAVTSGPSEVIQACEDFAQQLVEARARCAVLIRQRDLQHAHDAALAASEFMEVANLGLQLDAVQAELTEMALSEDTYVGLRAQHAVLVQRVTDVCVALTARKEYATLMGVAQHLQVLKTLDLRFLPQ